MRAHPVWTRRARRRLASTGGPVPAALSSSGAPGSVTEGRPRDPLGRLGRRVAGLLRAVGIVGTGPTDPVVDRGRGGAVLLAGCCLIVSPTLALAVGVVGWHLPRVLERRRHGRQDHELAAEVLLAVELCAVAVHSGATVPQTLALVAPHLEGRLGAALGRAVERPGHDRVLAERLAAVTDELGLTVAPLVGLLQAAHRDGDRLEAALTRLADRLRDERRRRVETDVRRLSVRLLIPLVCCSLPGFVCIAVVPMVLGSLGEVGG